MIGTTHQTQATHEPQATEDTCSVTNSPAGIVRHTILLRCFVYPIREDCYLAECIDLDISAEGPTAAVAKDGLRDAVLGYLHVTCDPLSGPDEKDIRNLILRPSPLTHRIRYHVNRVLSSLVAVPTRRQSERFFEVPAPCHC